MRFRDVWFIPVGLGIGVYVERVNARIEELHRRSMRNVYGVA